MKYVIKIERTMRISTEFEAIDDKAAMVKAEEIYDEVDETAFKSGDAEYDYVLYDAKTGVIVVDWYK